MRRTDAGEVLGFVQATVATDVSEIAWLVGVDHQRRGFAVEAVRAIIGELEDRGTRRFAAYIYHDHRGSHRVAGTLTRSVGSGSAPICLHAALGTLFSDRRVEPANFDHTEEIDMHAVLVKVRIDPARHDEAMQGLRENVVPTVKGAPGFVKGTWFGDTETGHAVVVFESDAQAQQMAATVTSDPGDPVQVEDVQVFEVHAEA